MVTLLKVLAAIISCIFGVLAIRAAATEKKERLGPSGKISVIGLIISLAVTLSLQLAESAAETEAKSRSKKADITLDSIAGQTAKMIEPIGRFEIEYAVTYDLNIPALTPLRAKLDAYSEQHASDTGLKSDAYDDKADNDVDPPVEFKIKPDVIKSATWGWNLFHTQSLILNLYNRSVPIDVIRRVGPLFDEDLAFRMDETPVGDIEFKIPVFGDEKTDHCRIIYNRRVKRLRIVRTEYNVRDEDLWTTNKIVNLRDLLGSHMLVRIKVEGMEKIAPINFMMAGATESDANRTYAFIDTEPELDYIAITASKRAFTFIKSDFQKKKSNGSGPRYVTNWPVTEEGLDKLQVHVD
jgi:hypothetical protein